MPSYSLRRIGLDLQSDSNDPHSQSMRMTRKPATTFRFEAGPTGADKKSKLLNRLDPVYTLIAAAINARLKPGLAWQAFRPKWREEANLLVFI